MNREEYLNKAVIEISKLFAKQGHTVPPVKLSCSWPGGGSKHKRIGECWPRSASKAGINEIFISPTIDDSVKAMDILTHELIHAIDDCLHGHRKEFSQIMKEIGLEGKPTATHAGERLHAELAAIAGVIGDYPHSALSINSRKKDRNRQLKAECLTCGAVWRMSQQWLDLCTQCPCCGEETIQIN